MSKDITIHDASRVCLVSDIHIGVHQNTAVWHKIALKWAKWLSKELKKKEIKDIIICGDLFHYRDEVAVNTIHIATQVLDVWRDFNIIILVGNHDAYYKDRSDINSLSILSGWPNINVISTVQDTTVANKHLVFCPWGTSLEDISSGDIIFGHFEIESFKLNHFKVCDDGFKSSELLDKTRLVVSGHFHHREEREYSNGTILYLGNPFQIDFGDVDCTKGYYILDIPKAEYTFTENKQSPKHHKIKLSELLKSGKISKKVQSLIKGNFIKFFIDQKVTSDDIDELLKTLTSLKPLSLNVDYTTNLSYTIDDSEYDFSSVDVSTAIEEFISMMELDNSSEVIKYTLDLYERCK